MASRPGLDIQNLYVFPSATNPSAVVLALTLHPLIPPGEAPGVTVFDPNALFTFKIDNTGDYVEDLIIQVKSRGVDHDTGKELLQVFGPYQPAKTGTLETIEPPDGPSTPYFAGNRVYHYKAKSIVAFAGLREDPCFFDVNAFFSILPDRANWLGPTFTDVTGKTVSTTPANPNRFNLTSFRPASTAQDFFKNFNVLAIVLELPRMSLAPLGAQAPGMIHVWATSADPPCSGPQKFSQFDRVGRPLVTTLLSTIANNRHLVNNTDNPTDDSGQLANDIAQFAAASGRSQATSQALVRLLVPDVITADLSKQGPASYLALELGAVGAFGGRPLDADSADTLLGLVFGNTLSSHNLVADDGAETPALTTDNVGPQGKHFTLGTFPYIGAPR